MDQNRQGVNAIGRTNPVVSVLSLAIILVISLGVATDVASAADGGRSGGLERTATAARIAAAAFPLGADNAIIATAEDYPDALAATSLAGALDAPVLLTRRDVLPADTASALASLGVRDVYLLGGQRAITGVVQRRLERGYTVHRVSGVDRYATAASVATETARSTRGVATFEGRKTVLIASAEDFADVLTAAPLAFSNRLPVLLVAQDGVPGSTLAALDTLNPEAAIVMGGVAAVSDRVVTTIRGLGIDVTRVGGSNRSETSSQFSSFTGATLDQARSGVVLARGDAFPDALTGGILAGSLSMPILLTDSPTVLGDAAESYLRDNCGRLDHVQALGGTAAVVDSVLNTGVRLATTCP